MAQFLDRVGPDGDPTYFADQIAKLAQTLQDLNEGVRAPMLYPAPAKRSDPTLVWLARAHIALAVETMQRCGHSRESEMGGRGAARPPPSRDRRAPRPPRSLPASTTWSGYRRLDRPQGAPGRRRAGAKLSGGRLCGECYALELRDLLSPARTLRVCPKTSGRITKFSEHEAD